MKDNKAQQKPARPYRGGLGMTMHEAGRSRRHFLKVAGGAAVLGAGLAASPLAASSLLARAADFVVGSGFPASGLYLSPVQALTDSFTAIGTYWEVNGGDGNQLKVQIRTSEDGLTFSEWYDVPPQTFEGKQQAANPARFFGRVQLLTGQYVQFQLDIPAGLAVRLVGLTFIDTSAGPVPPQVPQPFLPPGKPNKPYVISRADWGANEGYRFSGGSEVWGVEYRTPKAIFVHHSETVNNYAANPAVDVRGIYYYHAITQGWGDIGYNYLIDWKGNIYEGRYGGDDVVGGHAYQYNYGSVGICLIGSFKAASPTTAMLDSLVKLIAWKCSSKNINPLGRTYLVDRNLNCISGHRDAINTTCPGDACYSKLPELRDRVASILTEASSGTVNVDLKSVVFSPTTLKTGEMVKIEAVVTNTGTLPVESQEPGPGFVYDEEQTFQSLGFDKQTNKFRLAVDFTGNKGVSHPYRWGLGKTLQPGETVTVQGFVRMKTRKQTDMFGGIVQEYVKYFEDNIGTTRVQVNSPELNRTERAASRAADPNIIYFPETGHNLGYTFRRYWEQYGGLAIFGYPLTEEFEEPSPTEAGKSYLVQYFERNRFEYHPENKGTRYEVLLGLLGVQTTQGRTFFKVNPVANTADRVFFKETGHILSGAFYRYWKTYGGLPIFGYPISEMFDEKNPDDGKTYQVQYFERNRFEYHPENKGTRYEVLLGLLGKELCRRKGWL